MMDMKNAASFGRRRFLLDVLFVIAGHHPAIRHFWKAAQVTPVDDGFRSSWPG